MLLEGGGVNLCDNGGILGPLHAPFDLDARDSRVLNLLEPVNETVVLEGEGVVVHASAEGVLESAGLGAHAAVAAALADEGRHIALARVAEAQGAVDEDLGLNGGVLRDIADLVKAQLPCQHGAGYAELGCRLHARKVVDGHLGARVQGNVGQVLPDRGDEAEILDDDAVGADLGGKARSLKRGLDLTVVDEGVERHIYLAAAHMAVAHGAFKFLVGEVLRAASGVEIAHAHIDGVRAVLHRGDHSLGRPGGRKQFDHVLCGPLYLSVNIEKMKYNLFLRELCFLKNTISRA